MKIGDLVTWKHPLYAANIENVGMIVQFSESYTSGEDTGHSEICVQWLDEDASQRSCSWYAPSGLKVISENR